MIPRICWSAEVKKQGDKKYYCNNNEENIPQLTLLVKVSFFLLGIFNVHRFYI